MYMQIEFTGSKSQLLDHAPNAPPTDRCIAHKGLSNCVTITCALIQGLHSKSTMTNTSMHLLYLYLVNHTNAVNEQSQQLPKCHNGNTIGVVLQSAIKRPTPATFNANFYMCKYCMQQKSCYRIQKTGLCSITINVIYYFLNICNAYKKVTQNYTI